MAVADCFYMEVCFEGRISTSISKHLSLHKINTYSTNFLKKKEF